MSTAGFDPLRGEGLMCANHRSEADNAATYICFERQIHGFKAYTVVALCAAEPQRAFALR